MPLMQSSQDDLPYIDPPPSPKSLSAAKDLIASELASSTELHPSLPPVREPTFSHAIQTSFQSLDSRTPEPKIDLARYEAPSAPSTTDKEAWTAALRSAYTSSSYLESRSTNLGLLETFGKNAWLVGNSQLEDILRDLEKEVKGVKAELEEVEGQRRIRMEGAKGEVEELERSWRGLVGRGLEVQVAAERIREEINERRRQGANAGA